MRIVNLLLIASFLAACPAFAADRRPNILLIIGDDMGWMDCGANGSKYYLTPSIDHFATQGMRFTQAYSQPLCSPTRASLLTGQYSARHGITNPSGHLPPQPADFTFLPETGPPNAAILLPESKNYLEPAQYTLAEALRDAGYRTGHFGKWHLGLTPPHWPEQQGFDVAFHCEPSAAPPNFYFSPYGVRPLGPEAPPAKGKPHHLGTITDGPDGEYITDRLTDEAIKFIRDNKDRPFFLNLWHFGVHGPWGHKESITAQMAKRTDPTRRQDNPVMASMLKSVDESLGRVLDTLDTLKLADNTIVIFMSDNGGNTHSMTADDEESNPKKRQAANPAMASYRRWAGYKPPTNNWPLRDGKGSLYEGGTRVPLLVRWPGKIAPGATSDAVVGCIDLYPTLLDLIGLAPNPQQKIDGVSYAPVLRGTGTITRDAYFVWFPHLIPGVSVRKGDWKLIRRFTERPDKYEGTRELFNLRNDLGETKNLAAAMPDKVKELDALIDAFVRDTGALYPRPNPAYDPAWGLVPRQCKTSIDKGFLRVEADDRDPFLGTAQVNHAGPLTLVLRARSATGGPGKVRWTTKDQADFPAAGQAATFSLAAGNEWQDVTVPLHIDGDPRVIRLHLPAEQSPVEIQSIRYFDPATQKPVRVWDFAK